MALSRLIIGTACTTGENVAAAYPDTWTEGDSAIPSSGCPAQPCRVRTTRRIPCWRPRDRLAGNTVRCGAESPAATIHPLCTSPAASIGGRPYARARPNRSGADDEPGGSSLFGHACRRHPGEFEDLAGLIRSVPGHAAGRGDEGLTAQSNRIAPGAYQFTPQRRQLMPIAIRRRWRAGHRSARHPTRPQPRCQGMARDRPADRWPG